MIKACMEVRPKTNPEAIEAALNETQENGPALIPVTLGTTFDQQRGALALLTGKKWENGRTLRVWFDNAGPGVVERVKPYFLEWTKYANIHFHFVSSSESAEIRVGFVQGDGSWSYLGTDNLTIPRSEHTMNLGWLTPEESETEFRRVTLHEAGHLLGAVHEHQSPGGGGVPWDKTAVYSLYRGTPNFWDDTTIDHNIIYRYSESQTNFSEFDKQSIMAYPIPNELTIGDFSVGWNTQLSERDIEFISWLYPKAQEPKKPELLSTKSLNRFARESVTRRTAITKNGQMWAIAEPWSE